MTKQPVISREVELAPGQHRIVFLVGAMVAGGLEQQVCYLLQGMDRSRYRPVLVVWSHKESDVNIPKVRELNVPIIGYPVNASAHSKLRQFARLVRTLAPEVVHSYSFYTNFAAFCGALAGGAIAVGCVRNELDLALTLEKRPILGWLSAPLPRHQISNSEAARTRINKNWSWLRPKRLAVVSNGLDMDRFRDSPVPTRRPHVILGIGSLVSFKRWDRLLRISSELKDRGFPCVVQIAGDGPQRGELEALASSLGIEDRTHFLGYREDIADLIAGARIIVHTSDAEGTPNAIMEGMASGRPVVATDAGDVPILIQDGVTGFVVPREDEGALLNRVLDVITDDVLAVRLGCAARDYARREFSLPRLVERTFEVYCAAGWNP